MTAAAAKPPALAVRNLTKRYGDAVAVNSVSFETDGEIFGLLGANGAGKTTILKATLGLVRPDSGEIRIAGIDPRRNPIEAKRRVGYLPEELTLYERLTGWEFLEFVAGLKGVEAGSELEEELRRFDVFERRSELIGEYSLGMRKKIGLIAALIGDPKLILLDEPLNGLDAVSMRTLRLRLGELAAAGVTVVVSSHVMGFVERLCARVAVLRRGEIAVVGSPADLRRAAAMPDQPFDDVFLHFAVD